jgi:plasmid stabilization system protein ParE
MIYRVRWRPAAERDLTELWNYIAERNLPAADRYIRDIVSAVDSLREMPMRVARRPDIHEDAYAMVVRRHLVLFAIENGEVIIVRVYYGARDLTGVFDDFDTP